MKRLILLVVLGGTLLSGLEFAVSFSLVFAQPPAPSETKFTAADGAALDQFGASVATTGNTVAVGAVGDDDFGGASGSAYAFEQRPGGTWVEHKLTPSDGAAGDRLGASVAASGNTIVVGAQGDDNFTGACYVFKQGAGGIWVEAAKLTASDGVDGDLAGRSVATSGNIVVLSADRDDDNGSNSGSAYVFERGARGSWVETAKLTASDGIANDHFGSSVAVSGKTIVVGTATTSRFGSQAAYVYGKGPGGTWAELTKLTSSDLAAGDFFGRSVAASQRTVVVGARNDDDLGGGSGSAYAFEQRPGGTWVEHKLTASDGVAGDRFGASVAASGNTIVIGAIGSRKTRG